MSSLRVSSCARTERCAAARTTPREQGVRGAAVGLVSAALLVTGAQSPAIARPALAPPLGPSPEEQRQLVEAQNAKLEALLKKQMEQSAPVRCRKCSISCCRVLHLCVYVIGGAPELPEASVHRSSTVHIPTQSGSTARARSHTLSLTIACGYLLCLL